MSNTILRSIVGLFRGIFSCYYVDEVSPQHSVSHPFSTPVEPYAESSGRNPSDSSSMTNSSVTSEPSMSSLTNQSPEQLVASPEPDQDVSETSDAPPPPPPPPPPPSPPLNLTNVKSDFHRIYLSPSSPSTAAIDNILMRLDIRMRASFYFDSRKPRRSKVPLTWILSSGCLNGTFIVCNDLPIPHEYRLQWFLESRFGIPKFCLEMDENNIWWISVCHRTPMQVGRYHLLWGKFFCRKCRRRWSSERSRTNTPQRCSNCGSYCYPIRQSYNRP